MTNQLEENNRIKTFIFLLVCRDPNAGLVPEISVTLTTALTPLTSGNKILQGNCCKTSRKFGSKLTALIHSEGFSPNFFPSKNDYSC